MTSEWKCGDAPPKSRSRLPVCELTSVPESVSVLPSAQMRQLSILRTRSLTLVSVPASCFCRVAECFKTRSSPFFMLHCSHCSFIANTNLLLLWRLQPPGKLRRAALVRTFISTAVETWNLTFEVFTAVTMKNIVVWDVMPCGSCKNLHSHRRKNLNSYINVLTFEVFTAVTTKNIVVWDDAVWLL
jgi:hypothetical protein